MCLCDRENRRDHSGVIHARELGRISMPKFRLLRTVPGTAQRLNGKRNAPRKTKLEAGLKSFCTAIVNITLKLIMRMYRCRFNAKIPASPLADRIMPIGCDGSCGCTAWTSEIEHKPFRTLPSSAGVTVSQGALHGAPPHSVPALRPHLLPSAPNSKEHSMAP